MPLTIPAEPITVELDPAKWARATGYAPLLDTDGKMCCWGFACLAMGATESEILGRGAVSKAFPRQRKFGARVYASEQYAINDHAGSLSDEQRVACLNEDAAQFGLPVRFVLKGAA